VHCTFADIYNAFFICWQVPKDHLDPQVSWAGLDLPAFAVLQDNPEVQDYPEVEDGLVHWAQLASQEEQARQEDQDPQVSFQQLMSIFGQIWLSILYHDLRTMTVVTVFPNYCWHATKTETHSTENTKTVAKYFIHGAQKQQSQRFLLFHSTRSSPASSTGGASIYNSVKRYQTILPDVIADSRCFFGITDTKLLIARYKIENVDVGNSENGFCKLFTDTDSLECKMLVIWLYPTFEHNYFSFVMLVYLFVVYYLLPYYWRINTQLNLTFVCQ